MLREIALCRERGLDWYYLGYWVRDCRHLRYKSQYLPHERLIGGAWVRVAAEDADRAASDAP